MTAHKRSSHGFFKARQNTNAKNAQNSAAGPPVLPGLVQPSTTGTTSSSTTSATASSASSSAPTTSASSTQASSASSSSSSASSSATSTSSSSSSSATSSSSTTGITPLTTPALQPTYTTPSYTYSYSYPSLTTSTPSATSSSASSIGGLSVGAIVGIVGGGLFGILVVLALGSYLLRWWRRHSAERDFVDEYNDPPVDHTPSRGNSVRAREDTFGPPMSQYPSAQSFGTGAGMAGQGVMASRAAMRTPGYGGGYGGYPNVDDEVISGAFSSQPQPQAPYNPEAYSSYVPYNGGAGYQDAVRGYQGQRAFEAPVNVGYAISEPPIPQPTYPHQSHSPPPAPSTSPRPAPSTSPVPRTTAAAALAAAQAAAVAPVATSAPQDEEQRKSAIYTEEDAYGGF